MRRRIAAMYRSSMQVCNHCCQQNRPQPCSREHGMCSSFKIRGKCRIQVAGRAFVARVRRACAACLCCHGRLPMFALPGRSHLCGYARLVLLGERLSASAGTLSVSRCHGQVLECAGAMDVKIINDDSILQWSPKQEHAAAWGTRAE